MGLYCIPSSYNFRAWDASRPTLGYAFIDYPARTYDAHGRVTDMVKSDRPDYKIMRRLAGIPRETVAPFIKERHFAMACCGMTIEEIGRVIDYPS